jgi:streptogramin lyase
MGWNDLADNQMVSYLDAQGGGFTLKAGQTNPGTNQCMTKAQALAMYNLNAANMASVVDNQLPQKSFWVADCVITNYTAGYTGIGVSPISILLDPSGNLFVGLSNDTILKILPNGTSFKYANLVDPPDKMAMAPNGDIYSLNRFALSIYKITPSRVVTKFAQLGTPFGNGARNLVIDSSSNVYTCNYDNNNITRITPSGVRSIFSTTGTQPTDIVIDSSNNLYTSNENSFNVSKITPSGVSSILGTIGSPNKPLNLSLGADGNIYTYNNTNTVTKITPSGVVSTVGTIPTGYVPSDMVLDSFNNIYISAYNNSLISGSMFKLTQDGTTSVYATFGRELPEDLTINSNDDIYVNVLLRTQTQTSTDYVSEVLSCGTGQPPYTLASLGNTNYTDSLVCLSEFPSSWFRYFTPINVLEGSTLPGSRIPSPYWPLGAIGSNLEDQKLFTPTQTYNNLQITVTADEIKLLRDSTLSSLSVNLYWCVTSSAATRPSQYAGDFVPEFSTAFADTFLTLTLPNLTLTLVDQVYTSIVPQINPGESLYVFWTVVGDNYSNFDSSRFYIINPSINLIANST